MFGDGLPSILAESADGWSYKRNTSASSRIPHAKDFDDNHVLARFEAMTSLSVKPNHPSLASGAASFVDIEGGGIPELVQWDGLASGFYHRSDTICEQKT
jgi:hypothetical protein